jgi:hypothetical protein
MLPAKWGVMLKMVRGETVYITNRRGLGLWFCQSADFGLSIRCNLFRECTLLTSLFAVV